MKSTSRISERDINYFRRLNRNLVFSEIIRHYAQMAEQSGLTKREIARRLGKDAGQVSRWLSEPANLTLDSISDLLLSMDAEMQFSVAPAVEAKSTDDFMAEFGVWVGDGGPPRKVFDISEASSFRATTSNAAVGRIGDGRGTEQANG